MAPSLAHMDPFGVGLAPRTRVGGRKRSLAVACLALVLLILVGTITWSSLPCRVGATSEPTRADIVFVIDATSSMGDEIEDIKDSLVGIGNRLANRKPQPDIRFGTVFYRDMSDKELVHIVPLSHDLGSVRDAIMDVRADGGGDWREHVGIGLHKALEMDWSHSKNGGVRSIYLVADAPPQNYDDGYDVPAALDLAIQMSVKVHVIGCSGLDTGKPEMQRIAKVTGGTFSNFERQHGNQHRTFASASTPRTPPRRRVEKGETSIDGPVIGLDLGTVSSVVGIYKNGRVEIIPNSNGNRITPSYIAFVEDERLFGESARTHAIINPEQTLFGMTRLVGRNVEDLAVQKDMETLPFNVSGKGGKAAFSLKVKGEDKVMLAEEALSMVIAGMKETAENYLGTPVKHAVVTVPAYFDDAQRQSVRHSAWIAGLSVVRIINEPTAAAIAYGLEKKTEKNIVVYDLGGGTFDVSLLTIDNGVFEVVATNGDKHLGGEDFDQRVLQHLVEVFKKTHGRDISDKSRVMQKLRLEVERAKKVLSAGHTANIEVEDLFDGIDFFHVLTRARFEELNRDLFVRTLGPLEQIIEDSGLKRSAIDEIILVGGSARIPKVQQLVKDFFHGKEPHRGINPDEAVAYGAAVQAGILSGQGGMDLLLLDVTPLTITIKAGNGTLSPLIARNTVIPTKKTIVFSTHEENQHTMTIQVFEGERPIPTGNHLLGEFNMSGIPPAPAGQPQIKVTLEIDSNGILTVGAEDMGTGKTEKLTITNDKGRLTEEQIEKMIQEAESFAEEDGPIKERVAASNAFTSYIHSMRSAIEGSSKNKVLSEKIDSDEKERVLDALRNAQSWMDSNLEVEAEDVKAKRKETEGICTAIVAKYFGAGGGGFSGEADEDDEDAGADFLEAEMEAPPEMGRLSEMMFARISDEL